MANIVANTYSKVDNVYLSGVMYAINIDMQAYQPEMVMTVTLYSEVGVGGATPSRPASGQLWPRGI